MRRNWTEQEVRSALALYLRLDFGKLHSRNPDIMALAARIGRTASAVALKLCNLAALDESLPQKGMANASQLDRRIWREFLQDPAPVMEAASPKQGGAQLLQDGFAERQAFWQGKQDSTRTTERSMRQGQQFFRKMILTSYRSRCALTGNEDARLLTASHIVGWAEDPASRLNPHNGLCLNALHDRAFDKHLITFDEDYRLQISADVPPDARRQLEMVENTRLCMPSRFLPGQSFLEHHRRRFHARTV